MIPFGYRRDKKKALVDDSPNLQTGKETQRGRRPQLAEYEHQGPDGSYKILLSMYQQRIGVRAEFLQEQQERIRAACSLADRFPELKTLTATLAYFGPDAETCYSELKCTFNLGYAKALFLFNCSNPECVGGNFDLSSELARAVTSHLESAAGESRCQGWKSRTTIDRIYCDHRLRYTLNLAY